MNKIDRFGNTINLGDVIAYCGTNVGLIVGVVVGFNPKSYKVKTIEHGVEIYYNVLYANHYLILTAAGMNKVDPDEILNEVEKLRLEL